MNGFYYLIRYFFIFGCVSNSLAIDWEKCLEAAGGTPFINTFITTTSYVSSTGGCSATGSVKHDSKVFFAQNYFDIQVDIARGGGDYLESFLAISKTNSSKKLRSRLQGNFDYIYSSNNVKDEYDNLMSFLQQ